MMSPKFQMRGAGDLASVVFKPVAGAIDWASNKINRPSNLNGCAACSKRQHAWNKAVPFIKH